MRCIDDEIPFEIPESWAWCRIRDISQSYIGLTYSPSDVNDNGTIVLRSSNIKDGKLDLTDIVRVNKVINDKLRVNVNDIIICARNGSRKLVGKSALITEIHEPMTFGAFMAICKTALYKYVYLFLQSDLFFSQLRKVSDTTTINQLTQNNFNGFLLPIPPIEEQERIIARYIDLLPSIEQYSEYQECLDTLNTSLYFDLKKSILQEAIQGRLVPQDPSDEPAHKLLERIRVEKQKLVKEGKLKAKDITDSIIYKGDDNKYYEQIGSKCVEISEEIQFDIPESWSWCRLSQCCVRIFSGKSPSYSKTPTKHIIIGQQANQWERIEMQYAKYGTDDYAKNIEEYQYLLDGDVLLNTLGNGTLGRCGIFENITGKVLTDGHLFVFRTIEKSISRYILYYLTLNYTEINRKADGSTNQTFLNLKKVSNYLIPLPPLNEIKRIETKKEELYSKL